MNYMLLSLFLIFLQVLRFSFCFSVNCDDNGYCLVKLETMNTTFYPMPGYLPPIPQKFITSLKNITTDTNQKVNLVSRPKGYSFAGSLQNSEFICADGIGECVNSCCNMGYCTDPLFACNKIEGDVKLIFMIVGLVFVAILICYWVYYFLLGVWYNAEAKLDAKTDDFYNKNLVVQKTEHEEINSSKGEEKMNSASRSSTNSKDHDNIVPFARDFNLKKNGVYAPNPTSQRNNFLPESSRDINTCEKKAIDNNLSYNPSYLSNNTAIQPSNPTVETHTKRVYDIKESRRKPAGIINEFEEKVLETNVEPEVKITERPIIDFKAKADEEKEKSISYNKAKANKSKESEEDKHNNFEDI